MKFPLLATALLAATTALAQTSGSVGIGTTAPNAKAALEVSSTTQGVLVPRLTESQRTGIAAPVPVGLLVYQTDGTRPGFWYYEATAGWTSLSGAGSGGDNLGNHTATQSLQLNGNTLSNNGTGGLRIDNSGNVGVGVSSPTQKVDVDGGILARAHGPISNQGAYLQWNRTGGDGETWLLNQQGQGGINAGIRFGGATTGNAATEWARFRNDGNLGIGTTSPGQKLEVAGQIYSNTGGFRFPDGTVQTTAAGSTGDNLGNHTATQDLNLAGNKLVGGTTARAVRSGLGLTPAGLLTLGAARIQADTLTGNGVRLLSLDQDFVLTSKGFFAPGQTRALPVTGVGDRVMWLSYYSAFRAGGVSGNGTIGTSPQPTSTQWDNPNIGQYSVAFGLDNVARDRFSTAFGNNNVVRAGEGTTVMGYGNNAVQTFYGLMTGYQNTMRGQNGLVGGYQSKVQTNLILPTPSLAFGYRAQARTSQAGCVAIGYYARTGGYEGSFALADYSPVRTDYVNDSLVSTAFNQFSARFAGGYRLFTTTATNGWNNGQVQTPIGVELTSGANAWTVLSDSTKKERRVLADGNAFLERINRMRLGSWNYRGQSPDTMRHYGPMAQDFFAAFGHDGVGRSGNSTSINQADFDGVNLIAIQALYRRVLTLEAANARLHQQVRQLQAQPGSGSTPAPASMAALEERLRRLEAQLSPQAQR
ncbi:hypothetical protein LJ737_26590 [Hymenobacter sp. 15J16-1T3B]|uniref:tail fiber domain-containing protein n=1 Tax=Hymenobacter sp. 15J16-1T3B TaxID=2886941 RepID=UPI001D0FCBF4|nr:tail fiber domain-containing protein [Hymenobacter sp. 15J16-1T3B]MCC3160834.1 hypothetical protein [Hymenobacter sp. 15J16-1T3B]